MTDVQNLINFLSVDKIETSDEEELGYATDFLNEGKRTHKPICIDEDPEDTFEIIDYLIKTLDYEDKWTNVEYIIKYKERLFGFKYIVCYNECIFSGYVEYEYYKPVTFKIKK